MKTYTKMNKKEMFAALTRVKIFNLIQEVGAIGMGLENDDWLSLSGINKDRIDGAYQSLHPELNGRGTIMNVIPKVTALLASLFNLEGEDKKVVLKRIKKLTGPNTNNWPEPY